MGAERNMMSNVASIIGNGTLEINLQLSKKLLGELIELPSYFSQLLIARCANNPKAEKTTKTDFLKTWKIL